jgi:hypothetical protein
MKSRSLIGRRISIPTDVHVWAPVRVLSHLNEAVTAEVITPFKPGPPRAGRSLLRPPPDPVQVVFRQPADVLLGWFHAGPFHDPEVYLGNEVEEGQ